MHVPSSGAEATSGITRLGTDRAAEWRALLRGTVRHDFHHLPEYHRVAERCGQGTASLFAYREGDHVIALPLLLRPVDEAEPDGWMDATSVYGYAGPVTSAPPIPDGVVRRFQEALVEELAGERVVSVFSRMHPLIPQDRVLEGLGQTVPGGRTVSIDLTLPLDEQWAGMRKKTRRIIERARAAGVVCVRDPDGRYRGEWVDTYRETMRRVDASPEYFLDAEYFDLLFRELGPIVHLFVAIIDDRVAAAGLYTLWDGIVQAHLGSMRQEYLKLSPTRLLDDTVRVWGHEQGATVFHLGGGVGGREDSLFQYKAGFSDRRHAFATWRWIVEPDVYRDLARGTTPPSHVAEASTTFFPAYRAPSVRRPPAVER